MFDYWSLATLMPFGEELAVENLGRQGFNCYAPKCIETRISRGRRVEATSPLFPGYIFVQLTNRWRSIFGTRGIARLLLDGDATSETAVPTRVRDREIDRIRASELDGFVVLETRLRTRMRFRPGQAVQVKAGAAMEYQLGIFSGDSRRDRLRVMFSMLGRETPVYVRESDLVAA